MFLSIHQINWWSHEEHCHFSTSRMASILTSLVASSKLRQLPNPSSAKLGFAEPAGILNTKILPHRLIPTKQMSQMFAPVISRKHHQSKTQLFQLQTKPHLQTLEILQSLMVAIARTLNSVSEQSWYFDFSQNKYHLNIHSTFSSNIEIILFHSLKECILMVLSQ